MLQPAVSAGAPRPLGQMLWASSLEPQIHNWLPAAPQAAPSSPCAFLGGCSTIPPGSPGSPQAGWAWDSRALNPPKSAGHAQPQNPYFSMSLLLFCPCSSRAASPGCRICGQFLEMSVYVGQYLWGISVACSLFPTISPFFSPEASQSCAVLQLKCATAHRIPWDAESRFVASWQG